VSCGTGENKRREMLTFEVANFDIRYNCILGRSFLLRFMTIIHTMYATIKMLGPIEVITLKSDQCDALSCENATLTYAGRFSEKEAQELAAKAAKTHGGSTPAKTTTAKPVAGGTPRPPPVKKGIIIASASNQQPAKQTGGEKMKEPSDKDIPLDPNNAENKLRVSTELSGK
jgi:hypothetical protein